jgi:membrane-associated phospholipid phosphatase
MVQIGLAYFIRACFLIFIPIGPPAGSIPATERLSIWGFANHAYFPGGHMGVLVVYAMNLPVKRLRPLMWVLTIVFAIGTILNKNHYTADSLGGLLVGLTAVRWGKALYDRWFPSAAA